MTKPKLTPWFPPDVLPVRDGVYKIDFESPAPWYRAFRDGRWRSGGPTIEFAAHPDRRLLGVKPWERWRGLAEEPK